VQHFRDFFEKATGGYQPYGYQARLARDGLPSVVQAATGTGKTGVILAWLWRRLYGPDPDGTPRRLVYALPQRSLVEQVAGEAERWLANLELSEQVALHVVMGAEGKSQRTWRLDMHKPAIVVGTVDSLVSKALNRGYGIGRPAYPIDFALVTNGAHWVIDEMQLCPESTTTLRQLAAFAETFNTAEPFRLTCMSATVPEGLLKTVNNPLVGDVLGILPEERTGELAVRLNAARTIRQLAVKPGKYAEVAAAAEANHRAGTLTLVVVNTVDAARSVYQALRGTTIPHLLIHSRFRGVERAKLMERLAGLSEGIVVATQVVEAGLDLNAATLITEAAPWPSVVQRAGRCNRTGNIDQAELLWIRPVKPAPYEQADIDAASAELDRLEGSAVTGEDLVRRNIEVPQTAIAVLHRSDFVGLFDTAPDLSGAELDIGSYVLDADDLDVQLAWATWAGEPGAPPADANAPAAEWRCRVPLGELTRFMKRDGVTVWRLDYALGGWAPVTTQARARPGEVVVTSAATGGYDPELGLSPTSRRRVPVSPELRSREDLAAEAEDSYAADPGSEQPHDWETLTEHSEKTRAQAEKLLTVLHPTGLPDAAGASAVAAAYLHDVGKAHKIWQNAICALEPEGGRANRIAAGPWAKSNNSLPLRFEGDVPFRHELASLLILDGPLRGLLARAPDPDLTRFLVLAHHGKLRVQVRDPGDPVVTAPGAAAERKILGLAQGSTTRIPPLLGQPPADLVVDLDQFYLGGERSWTRTVLALRDRYGPFKLAYLEALVRIADWRASAGSADPE
jgi:CRISPR-associated endonuclease/helicase Cas3